MRGYVIYLTLAVCVSIWATYNPSFLPICAAILLLLFIKWRLPKKAALCIIIAILISVGYMTLQEDGHVTKLDEKTTFITGIVYSVPENQSNSISFVIKDSYTKEKLMYRFYTQSENEHESIKKLVSTGNICEFKGSLKPPSNSRNPNSFNYREYLYHQSIYWEFIGTSLPSSCYPSSHNIHFLILSARQHAISHIHSVFSEEVAPIIQALLFGYRENLAKETINAYEALGIVHILAISGLHINIIFGVSFYAMIRIGATRQNAAVILCFLLPVYAALAGGAPSVLRATIMMMLVLLSYITKQKWFTVLDSVSIACLIILVNNPYTLFQIGFQLSFVVTICLILTMSSVKCKHPFVILLYVSAIAQISSLPIITFYFYKISLISLLMNMIFVPIFSLLILPISWISFIVSFVHPFLGNLIALLLQLILYGSNILLFKAVQVPGINVVLGKPYMAVIFAYGFCIIYLFVCIEQNNTKKSICGVLLLVTLLTIHANQYKLNPFGYVYMLDVGQGDCIVISLPYRKAVYVLDTGGSLAFTQARSDFDVGEKIVTPFLQSIGVRKIDKLIISHGDYDHAGSYSSIMKCFKVETVLIGETAQYSVLEQNIIHDASFVEIGGAGDYWKVGNNSFVILAPFGTEQDENEGSLVIYATLGGKAWLFTGDIPESQEKALLQHYPLLRADVLKVAHHGSKTSTSAAFLERIMPTYALISVGRHNLYNHPNRDVLKRLRNSDTTILRTDLNGAIVYRYVRKKGVFFWMNDKEATN
ncbi:DNA internalization-related competence protein ComEC/Rec2 [Bacillus sp. HMF5848]|uniref:DNA internalization-related competence protein ComEC/Rec2 n=1 Tax=Bacillus sp. HMF5848 TaxID=2495421 RepID=UPI000F777F72|nr:DNA internalization-related competence protein ComEC/Rec2 [Bacillus sp. HMF5848]RSK27914.1 DNA internalization-related competence protein ComEC/Rec2 [Bacillus sp. HMF5848]